MTLRTSAGVVGLVCLCVGAAPATGPSTRPNPYKEASAALQALVPSDAMLRDAGKRGEVAGEAKPLLRKLLALQGEMIETSPVAKQVFWMMDVRFRAMLAVLGDEEAVKEVESSDAYVTGNRAMGREVASFLLADSGRQGEMVRELVAKLEGDPMEDRVFMTGVMYSLESAATTEENRELIKGAMKKAGEARKAESERKRATAKAALEKGVGKPFVLAGTLVGGEPFSTEKWNGKVVVVDFWATWCGPCKAELPKLKQFYAKYHPQGVEVVGVSNDYSAEKLRAFVKADPEMPWPQLFDAEAAGANKWHPLSAANGVNSIPRLFVIDRRGVLRSVEGREELETLVPKLLAENVE